MILTDELIELFKDFPLHSQNTEEDPFVVAKLFDNSGMATWYLIGLDPKVKVAFGYVTGLVADEWGYVSISELEEIKHPFFGIPRIERDLYFTQAPVSQIIPGLGERRSL